MALITNAIQIDVSVKNFFTAVFLKGLKKVQIVLGDAAGAVLIVAVFCYVPLGQTKEVKGTTFFGPHVYIHPDRVCRKISKKHKGVSPGCRKKFAFSGVRF